MSVDSAPYPLIEKGPVGKENQIFERGVEVYMVNLQLSPTYIRWPPGHASTITS